MPILEIENLSVCKSGIKILNNISFSVGTNEIKIVFGKNGAGKSTLINSIINYGDYKKTGKITFCGENITNKKMYEIINLGVNVVWQHLPTLDDFTVRDYLLINNDVSESEMISVLDKVGLNEKYLDRYLDNSLSGGERKKIELAYILLKKPKLAIFDAIDSGIDIHSLSMLKDILRELKKTSSVLMITHNKQMACMGDSIIILDKGKLIYDGDIKEGIKKFICLELCEERCLYE